MRNIIFQLFLTSLLGITTLQTLSQNAPVVETLIVNNQSAFAHSYRERIISLRVPSREELKAGIDELWAILSAGIRESMEESDDIKAAGRLRQIRYELEPIYTRLVTALKIWKKAHSKTEIRELSEWYHDSPGKKEFQLLQADTDLIHRTEKSTEFNQAYVELIRSISKLS